MDIVEIPECRAFMEAVIKIMNGEAVPDLEEIRLACNCQFAENHPSADSLEFLFPMSVMIVFIANSENRILLGEDSESVYANIGHTNHLGVSTREQHRNMLNKEIERYQQLHSTGEDQC